jgi:anti-sigma factor RsiW
MNHPKREEWAPYLFGEATPEARHKLAEHLQDCPDCAAEIAGWRQSLNKLDRWKLPRMRARSAKGPKPLLKWGVAAALVLGAGVGLGRWSAPKVDLNTLQSRIEASVKSLLAVEPQRQLNADLQSALAAAGGQITNEFRTQLNSALAGVVDASMAESQRQLGEVIQAFNRAREEDRRITLSWIEKIQKQHAADYLSLRTDLETVASLTDEEIRRARQRLNRLAANNSNNEP